MSVWRQRSCFADQSLHQGTGAHTRGVCCWSKDLENAKFLLHWPGMLIILHVDNAGTAALDEESIIDLVKEL